MTIDSERDRVPRAIASVRRALGSLASSFSSWKKDLELELDRLRRQLSDKETEVRRLDEARVRLEMQIATMRTRDPHTGLPNRAAFIESLEHRLDASTDATGYWIVVVRLWQFEQLRHSLGASAAADLMKQVSVRLEAALGPNTGLSRIGDQELGFVMPRSSARTAGGIGDHLLGIVEDRFKVKNQGVYLHAVVGLVETSKLSRSAAELLDRAGLAADDAIAKGEKWVAFREERHEELIGLLQLEADLKRALENNELHLHFQPVVNVAESGIVGLEALLRWHHPSGAVIMPDEFIPIAAGSGEMPAISEWVFRTGIEQVKAWRGVFKSPLYLSMNLTPRDLNPEFCAGIMRKIHAAGIAAEQIGVEITETAVVRDFKVAAKLISELSERGIRVLLDDFGTGYSSMSYLRELPFDCVKIDKSFVHRMAFESRDFGLVRSIVSLVQYLQMECVAEGIETQEQLDLIAMIDCNYWQGNFFSEPVPAHEVEKLLERRVAASTWPTTG
jgi:predicted signal transduction protein with EAL and GGDEF domain